MSKRIPLLLLPFLIALTSLGCNANTSEGPALSSALAPAPIEEEPSVDVFVDEYSDLFEQDFDESVSPPFALGEGQSDWDPGQARPPLAETTPLSQEQIQDLLGRLPPLQEEPGDVAQVRLPDQNLPPPRPGQEVELPFPPPKPSCPLLTRQATPWQCSAFHPKALSLSHHN